MINVDRMEKLYKLYSFQIILGSNTIQYLNLGQFNALQLDLQLTKAKGLFYITSDQLATRFQRPNLNEYSRFELFRV